MPFGQIYHNILNNNIDFWSFFQEIDIHIPQLSYTLLIT